MFGGFYKNCRLNFSGFQGFLGFSVHSGVESGEQGQPVQMKQPVRIPRTPDKTYSPCVTVCPHCHLQVSYIYI